MDIKYLAGFIDADGCIMLIRHRRKLPHKRTSYYAKIVIDQKDKSVLEHIQKEFGGHIYSWTDRKFNRTYHRLKWDGDVNCLSLLTQLNSHLILKKEICNSLIKFIQWRKTQPKSHVPNSYDGICEKYWNEIHDKQIRWKKSVS